MGILPHHAPLISILGQGVLRLRSSGREEAFAIFGGFLQVRPDRVVVLAETADMASEIELKVRQTAGLSIAGVSAPEVAEAQAKDSASVERVGKSSKGQKADKLAEV